MAQSRIKEIDISHSCISSKLVSDVIHEKLIHHVTVVPNFTFSFAIGPGNRLVHKTGCVRSVWSLYRKLHPTTPNLRKQNTNQIVLVRFGDLLRMGLGAGMAKIPCSTSFFSGLVVCD